MGCFSPLQVFDSEAIGFGSLFSAAVESAAGLPYDGACSLLKSHVFDYERESQII